MSSPSLTLHVLPPSHPSRAAEAALLLKGLDFEKVDLNPGQHVDAMQEIYGEGNYTVPGLVVDGEPVHGSSAIFARLEEIAPDPPLFPAAARGTRWRRRSASCATATCRRRSSAAACSCG